MKYEELIQFEPITSVIKLVTTDTRKVQEGLVKSFVFSHKMLDIMPVYVTKNLHPNPDSGVEQKGVQVVGSYGTGKSHLMALVGAIAEDASLLDLIQEDAIRQSFSVFAGHYKVLRFEVGVDRPFRDVLFGKLEQFLGSIGVNFSFDDQSIQSYKEQTQEMLAAFEEAFPDKHLLVIVDEMLEYLRGRNPQTLNNDLMLLRQMGELCDGSRFKIIFGVQELLYRSSELQFAAKMLSHAGDRYDDLIITKEDVAHIVKQRLLRKTDIQKQRIREHLANFGHLFDGINTGLNEYVELFPVHPRFLTNFELIRIGKSQREILKTLSNKFSSIADQDVPKDQPGLITYDSYWDDIAQDAGLAGIPDVRVVKDKMEIITERISNHFTGARLSRRNLAMQTARALAIRILCAELDKRNGASALDLKEDLAVVVPGMDSPDLLTDTIASIATNIVSATSGLYVDRDQVSTQFYLRTDDAPNVVQTVRDYAESVLKRNPAASDEYFFQFLQHVLAIQQDPYRVGFQIWEHSLEWIDKRSFRPGYIFFGNPNERSTTEPIQQFYIYFCPIFGQMDRADEDDEVYFDFGGLSEKFREHILLLGSAKAKYADASSDQKALFDGQVKEYQKKAVDLFEREFVEKTRVYYRGTYTNLKSYQLPGQGASKEMIFSSVASKLLNKHFADKFPDYPAFSNLNVSLTPENFDRAIRSALRKLTSFSAPNREGDAILVGLRLMATQYVDTSNSPYAQAIRNRLKAKGGNKVLNRDEVLYPHYRPLNYWYSVDFNLDYQLMFVVLAAMVFKGEIEITWSGGRTLNASTFESIVSGLSNEDMFTFSTLGEPKGVPYKALKTLFSVLGMPDRTGDLDKPETLSDLRATAEVIVKRVVTDRQLLQSGLRCRSVDLLSLNETNEYNAKLGRLAEVLDQILGYNTFGKLRAFKFSEDDLNEAFEALSICETVEHLNKVAEKFEGLITYLTQAQSYVVQQDGSLFDDIDDAVNRLPGVLQQHSDTEYKRYETLLNGLKDSYADYYMSQYIKYRLSHADSVQREALLNSDKKLMCDIIQEIALLNKAEYQTWVNRLMKLKPADPSLTKARVKDVPYHDFNPREYVNTAGFPVRDMKDQLDEIFEKWVRALRSVFNDPGAKSNIQLLDDTSRTLATDFVSGAIEVTVQNAPVLRKLINELSKGFERVVLHTADIQKVLSKPMTIDEAREAFVKHLEEVSKGKERTKVRVVFAESD